MIMINAEQTTVVSCCHYNVIMRQQRQLLGIIEYNNDAHAEKKPIGNIRKCSSSAPYLMLMMRNYDDDDDGFRAIWPMYADVVSLAGGVDDIVVQKE